jgi:glycosyltransferase involved in cell wall biosynthesis
MADSAPISHPPLRRRATLSGLEKLKVSAVLIVKDGELHLDRVLSAVGFCDEIVVLDSGSTDRTREICAEHKVRFEQQAFLGFGAQRRRAVELAKHDWVLVIDDDEVLDYEAATTIQVLNYADPTRAWRIRRRTYIGAREVRFGEWMSDHQVRLFNRTQAQFNDRHIDEVVETSGGPLLTLQGSLHHYRFRDYADLLTRTVSQARARADDQAALHQRVGWLVVLVRVMWGFVRSLVLRQGFRDGVTGVMVALAIAIDGVLAPVLIQERDGSDAGT